MEITQLKRQLAAEINKRKTRDAATRRRKEERRAYADDLRGKCMTAAEGDAMTYFLQWLIKNYPKRMVLNSFRAMLGGRQDFELAAAMELWWNRALFVEFLEWRAEQEPDSSRLRSAIAAPLKCIEIVGALYARAVLMDKVFEAVRFFSASGDLKEKENWTTLNMAIVYEAVMDIARRGAVCIFVYT